jgi:hypothetical protein
MVMKRSTTGSEGIVVPAKEPALCSRNAPSWQSGTRHGNLDNLDLPVSLACALRPAAGRGADEQRPPIRPPEHTRIGVPAGQRDGLSDLAAFPHSYDPVAARISHPDGLLCIKADAVWE